jgi:hypothetical protein
VGSLSVTSSAMANFFLPSFFQKRLLRYALSRLQLIDADALDLDSLGIRWGQRSTIELRDVGLKLPVCIAGYLHIPLYRGDNFLRPFRDSKVVFDH